MAVNLGVWKLCPDQHLCDTFDCLVVIVNSFIPSPLHRCNDCFSFWYVFDCSTGFAFARGNGSPLLLGVFAFHVWSPHLCCTLPLSSILLWLFRNWWFLFRWCVDHTFPII